MESKELKVKNKEQLKKIAATLKHGIYNCGGALAGVIAMIFFAVVIGLLSFLILTAAEPIMIHLGLVIFFIVAGGWAVISPIFYLTLRNIRIRKEISIWLDDIVELVAYGEMFTTDNHKDNHEGFRVHFSFNDNEQTRVNSCKLNTLITGKNPLWKQINRKKIMIYYSPKYDEVMILRQTHEDQDDESVLTRLQDRDK